MFRLRMVALRVDACQARGELGHDKGSIEQCVGMRPRWSPGGVVCACRQQHHRQAHKHTKAHAPRTFHSSTAIGPCRGDGALLPCAISQVPNTHQQCSTFALSSQRQPPSLALALSPPPSRSLFLHRLFFFFFVLAPLTTTFHPPKHQRPRAIAS